MKKLTALFLSLAMIFATISLTAVPVSAASPNESWTLIFSEKGSNDTIEIRQRNVKQGVWYYSQVKFIVNGREEYMTQNYRKLLSFYTFKEICKKDNKLNNYNNQVWSRVAEIKDHQYQRDAIRNVMENFSVETMNQWTKNQFNKKIKETIQGYRKDLAKDCALKILDIQIPFAYTISNDIIGWIGNAMDIRDFTIGVVDIWSYQMFKALNFGSCAIEYETVEERQVKFYTQALCDVIENLQ